MVSYQCVPLDGLVQLVEQFTCCSKVEQTHDLSRRIPNCTCQLQILKYNKLHDLISKIIVSCVTKSLINY